jgi:hypothetical protein
VLDVVLLPISPLDATSAPMPAGAIETSQLSTTADGWQAVVSIKTPMTSWSTVALNVLYSPDPRRLPNIWVASREASSSLQPTDPIASTIAVAAAANLLVHLCIPLLLELLVE